MEVLNISECCVEELFFDHKTTVNQFICGAVAYAVCCDVGVYNPGYLQVNNIDVSTISMVIKNNGTVNINTHNI